MIQPGSVLGCWSSIPLVLSQPLQQHGDSLYYFHGSSQPVRDRVILSAGPPPRANPGLLSLVLILLGGTMESGATNIDDLYICSVN